MGFNMSDYEPVETRIGRFYADHNAGRILTDLVAYGPDGYIVRATVYRDADELPAATGYAQESVTTRGVNATSALENCETSAIGRALANLGYAPKGSRPSREEMEKASRAQAPAKPTATPEQVTAWRAAIDAATSTVDLDVIAGELAGHDLGAARDALVVKWTAARDDLTAAS